jgi:hypothetical protein
LSIEKNKTKEMISIIEKLELEINQFQQEEQDESSQISSIQIDQEDTTYYDSFKNRSITSYFASKQAHSDLSCLFGMKQSSSNQCLSNHEKAVSSDVVKVNKKKRTISFTNIIRKLKSGSSNY